MKFFGKKEKKECCCCQTANDNSKITSVEKQSDEVVIKILGSGCAKCNNLEKNTVEAIKQMGIEIKIQHITDFSEIAKYGVMTTPALVFNNKVLCFGKVLKTDEIIDLIQKEI